MPLGGVDTGCIDLETSGLWGYCTIFNSHVPRRGPINLPFLGMSVGGQTWAFCDPNQIKRYKRDSVRPRNITLSCAWRRCARPARFAIGVTTRWRT